MSEIKLIQLLDDHEEEREETFEISQYNHKLGNELWDELRDLSLAYVKAIASGDPHILTFVKSISLDTGYPLVKAPSRYKTYKEATKEIGSIPSLMSVRRRLHTLNDSQLELLTTIKNL
jgi:hypothetical protein